MIVSTPFSGGGDNLTWVGNPAPPRPVIPASRIRFLSHQVSVGQTA